MINIGQDIHVTRSMSHNQQRTYVVFNHPKTAQRECAIMLLLQKTPMYEKDIAKAIGASCRNTYETLTELRKAQLVRKDVRWYLVRM